MRSENFNEWRRGVYNGLPICFGYLAVSFALGIQCAEVGLTALQAFIMSFTNMTSAGEFAALGIIAAEGPFLEMAITQFIVNLRYLLMSCAMSQKIDPKMRFAHRFGIAHSITDEMFALSVCRAGTLNPYYSYGLMTVSVPGWTFGTLFGVIAGDILPVSMISALGIALYGMFMAIIMPETHKDRAVMLSVISAMVLSCIFTYAPIFSAISSSIRIIIITVVVASAAAILFPREEDDGVGV